MLRAMMARRSRACQCRLEREQMGLMMRVCQDALLEEEGAVPEDAGSNGSEGPDGISLHAMPHQARAAPAGLDSHAAHEVWPQ